MTLQDDALRLGELDRRVVRALLESDTEEFKRALPAYWELRKSLRTRSLDESAIAVSDSEAARVLRNISDGQGLPSDKITERLTALTGEELSAKEFDDQELWELGEDLFFSWTSHLEYVEALAELRPLILRTDASESVTRLVRQVKNCYALQQYDAAYGLCRTLLEAGIRDICDKCRLFPDLGQNVVLYEKYNWHQMRDKVSSGTLRERLGKLYRSLCEVLHARRSATREEAREAFRETMKVLELLYEERGL